LVEYASRAEVLIELRVAVGTELRRDVVVFAVRSETANIDPQALLGMLDTGSDRSFDQDPMFAFRLLSDIALRALSTAVNDPMTAVQAVAGIHSLLHTVVDRDLDIGRVGGADGTVRVVLDVPTWDDYLAAGVDELTPYVAWSPLVRDRMIAMVDELAAEAPPSRREALTQRRRLIPQRQSVRSAIPASVAATSPAGIPRPV
jgi:uncharacterized membrane protein